MLLLGSCGQQARYKEPSLNTNETQMEDNELTPETAHPKAKALMTEEFYWSSIEETGPFGNDDGYDASEGFREWREANPSVSPVVYLKELIVDWGYPPLDLNEMNEANLKKYIFSSPIGSRSLVGRDNAIVAVGFGQFVREGKIDEDIKALTKIAIKRQLLPGIIGMWDDEYQKVRTEQLNKMLVTVDKMNE